MLSILVCSIRPFLLEQLKENLERTVGVEYELLVHDNRYEPKGLCEVYNLLAQKAKFALLCFVHEDVIFTTSGWGMIAGNILSDNKVGLIGVAGCKYKSAMFSGWFSGIKELDCENATHRYPDREEKILLNPQPGCLLEEVVCLDGVFICCTKQIWQSVLFDEVHLKGFHLYDLDFSLRASRQCKVMVSYEIELIHITNGGDFGDKWIEATMQFHMRRRKELPVTKLIKSNPELDLRIAWASLDFLKSFRISFSNKLKWITLQKLHSYPRLYYAVFKFLLYEPLRLKHLHNFIRTNG